MEKEKEGIIPASADLLRSILNNVDNIIAILDKDLNHEYINEKSYREMLGYEKNIIIGKKISKIIHPEDLGYTISASIDCLNGINKKIKVRFQRDNESYIWVKLNLLKVLVENKEPKILLIGNDITEIERLKDLETKLINIIETVDKNLKMDLFRILSQKFNKPLSSIRGVTESLLKMSNLPENIEKDLKIIQKNGLALQKIINNKK
jgi:PAS domain S-box-containing protein